MSDLGHIGEPVEIQARGHTPEEPGGLVIEVATVIDIGQRHHDALRAINLYGFAIWQVFASKNIARHLAMLGSFMLHDVAGSSPDRAKEKPATRAGFRFEVTGQNYNSCENAKN